MNSEEVKKFYDQFLESKMLQYRITGNLRIKKATDRILEYVRKDSNVLEIGCGIGIISQEISKNAKEGQVWAIDISPRNIWYARQSIKAQNITFAVVDIINEFEKLKKQISEAIDVFVLADVIEHIPKNKHEHVFKRIRQIASENSVIILTYPSPQYQKSLKKNNQNELQIIDETIELDEILRFAEPAGYHLRHYSLENIWSNNQYVHCVFQSNNSLDSKITPKERPFLNFISLIKLYINRFLLKSFNRWKYVTRIFDED